MIIKQGRHFFWISFFEMRKGFWTFFLTACAFRMLIGWAGKLLSRGH